MSGSGDEQRYRCPLAFLRILRLIRETRVSAQIYRGANLGLRILARGFPARGPLPQRSQCLEIPS